MGAVPLRDHLLARGRARDVGARLHAVLRELPFDRAPLAARHRLVAPRAVVEVRERHRPRVDVEPREELAEVLLRRRPRPRVDDLVVGRRQPPPRRGFAGEQVSLLRREHDEVGLLHDAPFDGADGQSHPRLDDALEPLARVLTGKASWDEMKENALAASANGGSCYNCHQLAKAEISFGNIGPSLYNYGKLRGVTNPNSAESKPIVEYTWGKIQNARAYNACSNMPRFAHKGILTEVQIKHVMALLLDPASPVNK